MKKYNFQYCQKIVVYSKDQNSVLLCKRKYEADFDGEFSFIGGKMETTDKSIVDGLKREKDEEVGSDFKIRLFPTFTTNIFYTKKDGSAMILPHFYSVHESGDIDLNEEYSEFRWIKLDEIGSFEPKIFTVPEVLEKFSKIKKTIHKTKSVII